MQSIPTPRPRGWRCRVKSLIAPPNAAVEPQNHAVGMEPHLGRAASSVLCSSASARPGNVRVGRGAVARSDINMDTEDEDPLLSALRYCPCRGHLLRRFMATHPEATATALAGMQDALPTSEPRRRRRCCLPAESYRSHAAAKPS